MSVLERTREFGVLLALGTRPRRIVALVFAESFWIASLSAVLGLVGGLAITWYGSRHVVLDFRGLGEGMDLWGTTIRTALRTSFDPGQALRAAAFVYLMALGVGVWPAAHVARLRPAVALRRA
jgi:ABC-type antimicrobial peptide transport system permease subunit